MPDAIQQPGLFRLRQVRFRDIFTVADLTIRPGHITVLRGPSGSGKTTLLRMLNRMTVPDSGTILYQDRSLESIDPVSLRRQVVMLTQTPVLFEETVRAEVSAGRIFADQPALPDAQITAALAAVGLPKSLDDNPGPFSGGEKQRLALARVLLMEPPVLLLDEPSAALDQETEERIFRIVLAQREAGRSVILASHSSFTSSLGDLDLWVLENGQLVQQGAA